MNKTPLALSALALGLTLTLTGCSTPPPASDDSATASAPSPHSAEVMFATMMIPHHEQALEMADLVLAKDGLDPRIVDLATQISAAQGPEIERMRGWLDDWGITEYSDGGMDHDSMSGMMSKEDMAALERAGADAAGILFLEQMIEHHEGAVAMAESALDDAEEPEVRALAEQVVADQEAEIATMQALLEELS